MRQILRMSSIPALVFAGSLAASGGASAVTTIAQGPCTYDGFGRCLVFKYSTVSIPIIRSFSFSMPGAGDALINFQGDIHCANNSIGLPSVIDLVGQIVTSPSLVPNYQGPGGAHLAVVLPIPTSSLYFSNTLNFSATRRIHYTSGGIKTVHFKVAKLRMDTLTDCTVFTAAFNAIITP